MKTIVALACGLAWLGALASLSGGDEATSSSGEKETVTIEGKISDVMEIDPPRLNVEVKSERYTVQLLEETKVLREQKPVNFGRLQPKQWVRIKGTRPGGTGRLRLNALEVEILKAAPR